MCWSELGPNRPACALGSPAKHSSQMLWIMVLAQLIWALSASLPATELRGSQHRSEPECKTALTVTTFKF